ncbi:MAG: sigma factor-like helix-turn-helix DNA-binding protein [Ferruginibacter sp.]
MKKKRWLNNIIFDTELIDHSYLSETERYSLKSFLLDNKTLAQIGKEIETSDERARQIIKNAIGKILLNTNNLIAKSFWLQKTLKRKINYKMN